MTTLAEKIMDSGLEPELIIKDIWERISELNILAPDLNGFDIVGDNSREFVDQFTRYSTGGISISDINQQDPRLADLAALKMVKSAEYYLAAAAHTGLFAHIIANSENKEILETYSGFGLNGIMAAYYGEERVWITDIADGTLESANRLTKMIGLYDSVRIRHLNIENLDNFIVENDIVNPLIVASLPNDKSTNSYIPFLRAMEDGNYEFLIVHPWQGERHDQVMIFADEANYSCESVLVGHREHPASLKRFTPRR